MRPNGWSLNGWEGLDDGREVPTPHLSPWRRWLFSGEQGRGSSVSAGVGLAKEIITSHPRRPIGMVGLLILPDGDESAHDRPRPFGRGSPGEHRWQIPLATTAATITSTLRSARTSAREGRCARELMMEKTFFPRRRAVRAAGVSERDASSGGCFTRSCDACPCGSPHRRAAGTYPSLTRALRGPRRKTAQALARGRFPAHEDGDVEPHPDARVEYPPSHPHHCGCMSPFPWCLTLSYRLFRIESCYTSSTMKHDQEGGPSDARGPAHLEAQPDARFHCGPDRPRAGAALEYP